MPELSSVFEELRSLLGTDNVLDGAAASQRYGRDTSRLSRVIAGALRPASAAEVSAIVRLARRHQVPLYPISTGRNWGYGTANPAVDHCVVVDLSRMKQIAFDDALGLLTVEPGVTQGDLWQYLQDRNLPYLVPVTGAGPNCSLVGNALERGYGPTPHTDHFGAVMGLEAVLPSGECYRSPLAEFAGEKGELIHKWGVGPYLDGLFAQGNFGIVTRMTLALVRRPERSGLCLFSLRRDDQLEAAVRAVHDLLSVAGSNVGGVNLMSDMRVLTMSVDYPRQRIGRSGALSDDIIAALARRLRIGAWTGVCSVYGSRDHVAATRRLVRRVLGPHVQQLFFLDSQQVRLAERALKLIPVRFGAGLRTKVERMARRLDLTEGRPSELALPLAYWRSQVTAPASELDPARDGCGLLWYAPVVPMRPEPVRRYVDAARRLCREHGFDAPITLTSLSERAFDSTIPLLFSRDNHLESARAEACYRALLEAGRAEGFLPYRIGSQFLPQLMKGSHVCADMASTLKRAIDPSGILAPGRYSIAQERLERQNLNVGDAGRVG